MKIDHSFQSDNFRTVLNYPDLPACKILKDGQSNPWILALIDSLRPMAPEILELCSRTGRISAQNVTFENSAVTDLWPKGSYKVAAKFFDSMDNNIVNISYTATIF